VSTRPAVRQGGRTALVVTMNPIENGLVLSADVGRAGGRVELPGRDEVKRLKAFACAGMFRGEGGTP
jgi:hypothetical protein